jgi:hypothetical protein
LVPYINHKFGHIFLNWLSLIYILLY